MKGIVFEGFLQMVEENYGYKIVDQLLTENDLASGGIYTSVGTYDHREMVKLISTLGQKTGQNIPSLLKAFGLYFFGALKNGYPQFLEAAENAFDFLQSIENHIHVEVKKLYPDAELPSFKTKRIDPNTLEMIYQSERKMADFAEGLIEKSLEYYGENALVEKTNLDPDGSTVQFIISKK
ncbi:MAG: heme NO-binding domain-containing protein [Bacteroidota bacterium]